MTLDPRAAFADPLSVKLLRLAIQHCLDLADEAGLTETALHLQQALDCLGGPLT